MGICYSFAFVGNKCIEKGIEYQNRCKIKCKIVNEEPVKCGPNVLVTWFGTDSKTKQKKVNNSENIDKIYGTF